MVSEMSLNEGIEATILIVHEESNPNSTKYDITKCSNLIESEHQNSSNNNGPEIMPDKNYILNSNLLNTESLKNLPAYRCKECSEIFNSYPCYEDHLKQVKFFKSHFTCKECLKPFERFIALMKHSEVEHSRQIIQLMQKTQAGQKIKSRQKLVCKDCPHLDEFKTDAALYKHLKEAHTMNCESCKMVLCGQEKINKHMKLKHNHRLDCSVCGKVMNTNQARKTHELTHDDRSEMCWICGLVMKNKHILSQHLQKHNEKTLPCNICNRVFPSPLILRRHQKTHYRKEEKSHVCHVCAKAFTRRKHLEKHILAHSKNELFKCQFCGRNFKCQEKLLLHEKKRKAMGGKCFHVLNQLGRNRNYSKNTDTLAESIGKPGGNTPLDCDICGRKFKKAYNVIRHKKYHFCQGNPEIVQTLLNEPEEYKCFHCDRIFFTKHALQFHSAVHTGAVKPFECEFCLKKFRTRPQIMVHERMHSGERPYPCKLCGNRFQTKTHLRHHEHIHSKEKAYVCPLCGVAFKSSGNLMEHTFRHKVVEVGSVRPYQCTFCGNRFISERVLKAHITRNHSFESELEKKRVEDKNGVKCYECGKILVSLLSLKRHVRRMHRNELIEVPNNVVLTMKDVNVETYEVEDFEDESKDYNSDQEEYLDVDYLEMSGSDIDLLEMSDSDVDVLEMRNSDVDIPENE